MFNLNRTPRFIKYRSLSLWLLGLCILFSCSTVLGKDVLRKIPRSERSVLVVLNFRNNTPEDRAEKFQPWELGLASMMMTDIEKIGLFNIISSKDIKSLSLAKGTGDSETGSDGDSLKIGKLVSAQYVLSGSFMEINGKLKIDARILSVEDDMQLGAESATGETDDFFEIEKQLVLKITQYLKTALDEQEITAIRENIETTSVSASLNNYAGEIAVLRAEEYRERGQTKIAASYEKEAKERFQKALADDPEYERAKKNLAKLVKGMPMTL